MSDLIKLTAATSPYEHFWVSASSITLVEPMPFAYGRDAKARIVVDGGEIRQCLEDASEVARLVSAAHTDVREVSGE